MKIHGSDGWPVETIEGRPIQNFVRLLIHANLWMTWKRRKATYHPQDFTKPNDCCRWCNATMGEDS